MRYFGRSPFRVSSSFTRAFIESGVMGAPDSCVKTCSVGDVNTFVMASMTKPVSFVGGHEDLSVFDHVPGSPLHLEPSILPSA
jgi:hypothetical protein